VIRVAAARRTLRESLQTFQNPRRGLIGCMATKACLFGPTLFIDPGNREFAPVLSKKRHSCVQTTKRFRHLPRNSLFSSEQGMSRSKTGNEREIFSHFKPPKPR
jgi:hypothetical protein